MRRCQIQEDFVEVTQHIPQERIVERIGEQIVDVPVLHIQEQSLEVVRSIPLELLSSAPWSSSSTFSCLSWWKKVHQQRISERVVEQIVSVPVFWILEETIEVVKLRSFDKVDMTVNMQGRVPIVQTAHNSVQVPHGPFPDPGERCPWCDAATKASDWESAKDACNPTVAKLMMHQFECRDKFLKSRATRGRAFSDAETGPTIHIVQQTVEVPIVRTVQRTLEVPVVMLRQVPVTHSSSAVETPHVRFMTMPWICGL